jgi:hypothetical protein
MYIYLFICQDVYIWSDNGPHHFKTNYHLWYLLNLCVRRNIFITHNYFAPHHGHNQCDAEAGSYTQMNGRVKRASQGLRNAPPIQTAALMPDRPIFEGSDGATNAHQLASILDNEKENGKLLNSTIIPLDAVDRTRPKPKMKSVTGLTRNFCFSFQPTGVEGEAYVFMRQYSDTPEDNKSITIQPAPVPVPPVLPPVYAIEDDSDVADAEDDSDISGNESYVPDTTSEEEDSSSNSDSNMN